MKFDAEQIKSRNPILRVIQDRYKLVPKKTVSGEVYFLCPFHKEETASFRVNDDKGVYTCGGCNEGGDVINFVMKFENVPFTRACELLGGSEAAPYRPRVNGASRASKPQEGANGANPDGNSADWTKTVEPTSIYEYRDEFGAVLFQSLRFQRPNPEKEKGYEKTFRQRRPDGNGGWIWKTEGVRLVIYNLPEVLSTNPQAVHICEGEKDCDTLTSMGLTATTNVAGAGKWKDAYSESLRDRQVVLWPDQDKPGKDHAKAVFDSVSKRAATVRIVNVPEPYKDVTEWWEGFVGTDAEFTAEVLKLVEKSTPLYKGVEIPLKGMEELEEVYRETTQKSLQSTLDISKWIPSFRGRIRGLVPGELVVMMGETGIGKTALLGNLAINSAPLTTLFFEMELPEELSFERFIASAYQQPCKDIYDLYSSGQSFNWRSANKLGHISVCSRSNLTCDEIERIIVNSELKIGSKPALVLIDYIGLIKAASNRSRYERVSDIAEHLKVIAKNTKTIIVLASQIHRRHNPDGPEIGLYDAKDSGSIENSCGLVIGAWRDEKDASILKLKVLKNTKGRPGFEVNCNFNGETMLITELAKISEADAQSAIAKPELNYENESTQPD